MLKIKIEKLKRYFTAWIDSFYSANYNLGECTYIWGEFCGKIMSNLNTFLSIKYQNNSCYAVCIFGKKNIIITKKNEILSKQTVLCKNICGPWPGSCKSELLLKVNCRVKFKFAAQNFKDFSKKKKKTSRSSPYFYTHIIPH